ncbi:hypothetical protein IIY24_02840, partial [Candidatus Saccharibacteria bacterium]|nr:hypothetical protein [Candidatus Saccharibacteria bacterium]
YDSALAGVEDAKIAFYNYKKCLASEGGANGNCEEIVSYMKNPTCDMVGRILGRMSDSDEEVVIRESSDVDNNMQQAYTCVKIKTKLDNIEATLSSTNQIKVFDLNFVEGTDVGLIRTVRVSWFSDENMRKGEGGGRLKFTNWGDNKVRFKPANEDFSNPPTISVALIQAGEDYSIEDFDVTRGDETNRGMVYLVPTDKKEVASTSDGEDGKDGTYIGAYNSSKNYISTEGFLKSNDKTSRNLPYGVYCAEGENYVCSADIDIPMPIGGSRSEEAFRFVIGLPYGAPETDVSLEFICKDDDGSVAACGSGSESEEEESEDGIAILEGVQVEIDSTGRANDLFRRVQARLEAGGTGSTLSVMGPLELLGNGKNAGGESGNDGVLMKGGPVISEHNFR